MDKPSKTAGILTLDSTSNVKDFNIALGIPQQTIYLRATRIEFDTAPHALSTRLVYVDLPFLSANQLLDGNVGQVKLPLLLHNDVVSSEWGKSLPLYLSGDIPTTFTMRVYDTDFNLVSNLVSISLQFELEYGLLTH